MTISNSRPAYRVLAAHGFYGPDDHLYEEGQEIYYDDEPNEEFEPLNELARLKLTAYLERLDGLARDAATKSGKAFVGRARTLDGAIQIATEEARDKMAIMTSKKEVQNIERIEEEPVPEVGNAQKRSRGRPAGSKTVNRSIALAA